MVSNLRSNQTNFISGDNYSVRIPSKPNIIECQYVGKAGGKHIFSHVESENKWFILIGQYLAIENDGVVSQRPSAHKPRYIQDDGKLEEVLNPEILELIQANKNEN